MQHLLSNAAYYLRRAVKSAVPSPDIQVFVTSGQRYHLRSGMFRIDLDAFDAHLRRAEALAGSEALGEYERALALYRGDFLGNEPYEWAEPYRREYQRRFVDAAHKAAGLAVDCRDVKKAMGFYHAILARDPIDEEAARGLMRWPPSGPLVAAGSGGVRLSPLGPLVRSLLRRLGPRGGAGYPPPQESGWLVRFP